MPYKDPEKQKEYMRKYRTPYMREYQRRKRTEAKACQERVKELVLKNQKLKKDLETANLYIRVIDTEAHKIVAKLAGRRLPLHDPKNFTHNFEIWKKV